MTKASGSSLNATSIDGAGDADHNSQKIMFDHAGHSKKQVATVDASASGRRRSARIESTMTENPTPLTNPKRTAQPLASSSDATSIDDQSDTDRSLSVKKTAGSTSNRKRQRRSTSSNATLANSPIAPKKGSNKAIALETRSDDSDDELVIQAFPVRKRGGPNGTSSRPAARSRSVASKTTQDQVSAESSIATDSTARSARRKRASVQPEPISPTDEQDNGGTDMSESFAESDTQNDDSSDKDSVYGSDAHVSNEEVESDHTLTVTAPPVPTPRRRRSATPKKKKEKVDYHPELANVWDKLEGEITIVETTQAPQPKEINIKLLPFQLEGLHWLQVQEQGKFAGGILADEMGMGKTIQMISLMVTRRLDKPNLIVCPTVAIIQWYNEIKNRVAPDFFKVLLHHGAKRLVKAEDICKYDIVITTYSIIEQGYRKERYGVPKNGKKVTGISVIHAIEWGRVILDEAHYIKDRSCNTARSAFALKRDYKWSLSGTPLQNRVGELYSLIRFMDVHPYSYYFCRSCDCSQTSWRFTNRRTCDHCGHTGHRHYCWWNAEILKPIQRFGAKGEGLEGFRKLRVLLDRIMLRRTKLERSEELGLPPRVVQVRRDVFNLAEEELYSSLYTDSARTFNTYAAAGTVLNNYASIFSLLSRMRLAANHPDLVTTKLAIDDKTAKERLVCTICQEEAEDAIMSKCKHVFCREDARQFIQSAPSLAPPKCPSCFRPLSIDLTQNPIESISSTTGARNSIVNYIDLANWRSSTKIEALVEELTLLQRDDATSKSIVFSQFVSFLDLVQWRLIRAGFNVVKLDGRMAPFQRDDVINSFMTDPSITVFLVSLKAGGVALNLTEASRVFVLDPWWNPAAEDQAFDRIHRLGQYRPIKITRIIVENSIESRILMLQEKKKALFDSTVGGNLDALAKLSEEDLQFLFVL
ncbi:hypothetical protein BDV3_003821 [Batrachochytrium dendrobatidis]|uniref:DNA repair protein RAD16 n=1 Tax=Batrachochytrium dendrobatidis (strain JEL423) TaxID=403673 RepID=A0A177WFX5_BATDL|nr:hypothetical protein BDEG_22219 [Batrachochytrium dendrobatidis JEL423]